jgi:hypothetical protein
MNLLGCLVRLFALMSSRVSLGASSWFTGESAPSASPLVERERRPRVRKKTSQPSPTSPSAAALVRRGRDVRFASTNTSVPPGSPLMKGADVSAFARGGGGGARPTRPARGAPPAPRPPRPPPGGGGRHLPRRRLAPNRSLPPPLTIEPAATTA